MTTPKACAIILDYFGISKTIACLTSLIDQGLDTVIVVDNSGDKHTNIQLQKALAKFEQQTLPFKIYQIVSPHNLGYAAGVNTALRWLEKNHPHPYYLLINNDAQATSGMLQHLIHFMQEKNDLVMVSPVIDDGQKQIAGYWYHRCSGLMFAHRVIGTFQYLTGCCLLVDRRIISDGLFDEEFFMYGEDVELNWRLRSSGWKTSCVGSAIVKHEGVGSSRQGDYFYEYHMARGHLLLSRKLASNQYEMPFLYLGRLIAISARSIIRAIRYKSLIPIKAWINNLR